MPFVRRCAWVAAVLAMLLARRPLIAQQVIADVPVGGPFSWALAVDSVRNKTYVAIANNELMTVIDNLTLLTNNVTIGINPPAIAVNRVTNTIYVTSGASDTLTIVNGDTLLTSTIPAGRYPDYLALDEIRNKIYIGNSDDRLTVVDGETTEVRTVPLPESVVCLAVNPVTNKIYVGVANGTLAIVDGTTLTVTSIPVGAGYLAVNQLTNTIYAVSAPYMSPGTLTIIDGNTLATRTVAVGQGPTDVEVNPLTNFIYVANGTDNTVTAVNGTTLAQTTIPVGLLPIAIAVNPATDKVYIATGQDNMVTMLDGSNNSTVTIPVGGSPYHIAVDEVRNRVYVSNFTGGTVTVIAGANSSALQFHRLDPCRVVDTRVDQDGPIPGGSSQAFALPGAICGLPSNAAAYSLNVTAVPRGRLGYLTIWPTGEEQPSASTLNSPDGRTKANAAIVPTGANGAVSVFVTDTSDVILDVNGYFTVPGPDALQFYPLTPCRVADTRDPNLPHGLGTPRFGNNETRELPILASSCLSGVSNAKAYSMNVTVAPSTGAPVHYLTVWPSDQQQPLVSTLNDNTGTVVANAAIVPAAANGDVNVFVTNSTDVIVDINGYFAPPSTGGDSFYPAAPCRVYDTRANGGQPFQGLRTVNVVRSQCAPPSNANAYVFNATVVPANGPLGFLTLWPDGQNQPVVSTLNARDGVTTSNMAIVPTANGSIDAYASGLTQLILDISGYFAP